MHNIEVNKIDNSSTCKIPQCTYEATINGICVQHYLKDLYIKFDKVDTDFFWQEKEYNMKIISEMHNESKKFISSCFSTEEEIRQEIIDRLMSMDIEKRIIELKSILDNLKTFLKHKAIHAEMLTSLFKHPLATSPVSCGHTKNTKNAEIDTVSELYNQNIYIAEHSKILAKQENATRLKKK